MQSSRRTKLLRRSARFALRDKRQPEPAPDVRKRVDEIVDQKIVMPRRRRNAQALCPFRHRRIIDRLYVNAVLGKQRVARRFASFRIANKQRNNMAVSCHYRQIRSGQRRLGAGGAILMPFALPARRLQMADGRCSRRADCRRQGRGEDEAGRIRAHRIDQRTAAGEVTAETAECLRERAFDDVDAMHGTITMPPPRGPYMPTACTSST